MDNLLTIAEAANLLAIHPKHLRREFVNTGIIPVIQLGKGAKGDRIRPSDLEQFVGKRECYIKEEASGGSNSRPGARHFNDPLGKPASGRLKRQNAA